MAQMFVLRGAAASSAAPQLLLSSAGEGDIATVKRILSDQPGLVILSILLFLSRFRLVNVFSKLDQNQVTYTYYSIRNF